MLSIIIATHKRSHILHSCLEHLARQTAVKQLEVIVVSDGPDKATEQVCKEAWNVKVVYTSIKKAQQGVARNAGIKLATHPYCLFINDDIFLEPDACAIHIEALQQLNEYDDGVAVLGLTTWDPALKINKTMRFLEASGWQFGYPNIAQYAHGIIPANIQANYTYSSHVSVPTKVALTHPFTTEVQGYGWEDMEWGTRLQMAGITLYFEPSAIAYHHHYITLQDSLKRQCTIGKAVVQMEQRHPHLQASPSAFKRFAQKAQALLPTLAGKHRKAYLQGVKDAKKHKVLRTKH